jgi:arylsulfatase A-like enzyme
MTDDQDLMLGSLDFMPRLQSQLAKQGMTFTNFFVPIPLCCPARASLWRGQYVHNHQIYTNTPPLGGFAKAYATELENATLATALDAAGYRTALFGKYLNGYPLPTDRTYIPPGWDRWFAPITDSAYQSYDYEVNDDGVIRQYGQAEGDYITDVLVGQTVDFIQETAAVSPSTPFFAALMVYAPHLPAAAAPRHVGLFSHAQVPRTAAFNEADVSDKPGFIQAFPTLTPADIQEADAIYRARLRSLQAVDEAIKLLVRTLQVAGQLDNTYIFFTSDNGFHLGQHRFQPGKGTPYEEDIRVPLIVRGPGIPAGTMRQELATLIDLAPTMADAAGISLAVASDGRSLLPLLHSAAPATNWRQTIFVEHYRTQTAAQTASSGPLEPPDPFDRQLADAEQTLPDYTVLRTGGYKVIERSPTSREVYNLVNDPYELRNLASSVDPNFMAEAADRLAAFKTCRGPECQTIDALPPPQLRLQARHYLPMLLRN